MMKRTQHWSRFRFESNMFDLNYTQQEYAKDFKDYTEEEIITKELEIYECIRMSKTVFVPNGFLKVCSDDMLDDLKQAERVHSKGYSRGKVYDFDASVDGTTISMIGALIDFTNN